MKSMLKLAGIYKKIIVLAIVLLSTVYLGYCITRSLNWEQKTKPPNIIFIMADDLGWQDVGFMGSKWFETPNLDKLSKESMVFTQAYMYPTCSPSRAALLTGKQSFRTGVYNVPVLERGNAQDNIFSRWTLEKHHTLYSEPLRDIGYKLAHIGKWHLVGPWPDEEKNYPFKEKLRSDTGGDFSWLENHLSKEVQQYYPTGRGFQENIGGTWWGDPSRGYIKEYKSKSGGYVAPFKNPFINPKESDKWLTDRLTDEALNFISKNKEKPFFVNLFYYAPHRPTRARSKELLQKFLNKPGDTITGQGEENREEIAAYATMVHSVDENVQRILDYLDKEGLRKNTIIIFTSDNGFNGLQSTNKRLRSAKGSVYEGGLRVPLLVNWQNKIQPERNAQLISVVDYFPTFLELAGITNYKKTLDGNSFVPLLKGKKMKERTLFWHLASSYKDPPCSIIRKGPWKLIQFLLDGKSELYNIDEDLKETTNLIHKEPEITEELLNELTSWRRKNKVPLPPSSQLAY